MRGSYEFCRHTAVIDGNHVPFRGSVATPRVTDEHRAAHGWVTYTQTCSDCKSKRDVNQNGMHFEFSAWRALGAPEIPRASS